MGFEGILEPMCSASPLYGNPKCVLTSSFIITHWAHPLSQDQSLVKGSRIIQDLVPCS